MDIFSELLAERNKTHGDWASNASLSQEIKNSIRSGVHYQDLTDSQKEALDMLTLKIVRLVSGGPDGAEDTVKDMVGYATLMYREMVK